MGDIFKPQMERPTNKHAHINIYISPKPFSMPSPSSLMAFIPQFYSNYTYPIDHLTEFPTPAGVASVNGNNPGMDNTLWGQDNSFTPVHDNGALDDWDTMSKAWIMSTFSKQLWSVSDLVVPLPAISECKMGFYGGGHAGFQNFRGGYQPQIGDFEEDIKPPPACPNTATENWGVRGNQMPAGIKVERYSEKERKERILRYLKKRNQRNFNKTIKYACRKTLADRRVRVRGRFARKNELSKEDMARKKSENNHKEDFYDDESIQFQLKNDVDDDDWLQKAMKSFVFLSHSSPDDV